MEPDTDPGDCRYPLPEALAAGGFRDVFTPAELREVCQRAGENLGRADAGRAFFRPAADMIALWYGLDLPAWEAPYVLRAARLGYLAGYTQALVSGNLPGGDAEARAAKARWGAGWEEKLAAARGRSRERSRGKRSGSLYTRYGLTDDSRRRKP